MNAAQPLVRDGESTDSIPAHLRSTPQVRVGQASIAGVKPVNEDCIGIRIPDAGLQASKGVVVAIADGVSAAEAGKEAAEACVQGFLGDYYSTPEDWSVSKSAQTVLTALNRWLWSTGQRNAEEARGYVSTLSCVILKSATAHVLHVGDARVYLRRNGEWTQLTRDHRAHVGQKQHYLARAVGLDQRLEVDYRAEPVRAGDLLYLCTDGVHEHLTTLEVDELLALHGQDLETTARHCVQRALNHDSQDNLSCQFLEIVSLPPADAVDLCRQLSQLPFPPPLAPGMVLDGHEVIREIHASSRSQVYLVRDCASGEELVMKTPSVNYSDDPAYIERFVLEDWIGRRLDSPYIAKVIPPRGEQTCLYYLAEYVSGPTLSEWMRENPKPNIQEVVMLVDHIARGLQKFHRRESVHQDLKPGNIVLDPEGILKIVDFGSCHVAGIAEITTAITRDVPLGTRSYSAPELRWGDPPDARCDQFSLAVICYEMLTHRRPYGEDLEKVRNRKDLDRLHYVPAHQFNPLVPSWMDAALQRALSPYREQRYPELSEFIHDLKHPSPRSLQHGTLPLIRRDPLRFWKGLALVLGVTQLVTLLLLLG